MKPLFDAIMARFNSTSGAALRASVTGMWPYQAAIGTATPYAVFSLVDDTPEWTFTESQEDCTVQFSVYADSGSAANTATDALKTLFDWCSLAVDGYTTIYMRRSSSRMVQTSLEPNVSDWHYIIEYDILLEK